jgi:diguanylate cyclase (GGDEF)-like protein/PAS domain S-box-containing protein
MNIPNLDRLCCLSLNALSSGVIITDHQGKVLYLNRLAEQLTGWGNEQAAGNPLEEVFVVYQDENRKKYFPLLDRGSDSMNLPEYLVLPLSGSSVSSEIYISGIITPFKDSDTNFSGWVLTFHDVSHHKQKEKMISYHTFHDHLTGLYNRAFFDVEMQRLNSDRMLPLSLIMCDANGLKLVNDAFGHDDGDRLLQQVADILSRACRKEDIIARIGGDEFAILLPNVGSSEAHSIINRIHENCVQQESTPIPISISLGVATIESLSMEMTEVYRLAEERMYTSKLKESRKVRIQIIGSIRKSLEDHADETKEQGNRIKTLSLKLAARIGLGEYECSQLELLAMIHDIGKIAIPYSILSKPGKLGLEEWQIVRKHSEIGYRIAAYSPELAFLADSILSHHENWDGKGYPQGLSGEQIPITSRIIAIVDAYDILTNGRAYRKPVSCKKALEEIHRCAGTQFDPGLVEHFLSLMKAEVLEQAQ